MNATDILCFVVAMIGLWCWRIDARIGNAEKRILDRLDELEKKLGAH
jgi:hypothetical protein